ncbi:MAG: hypothetical protein K8F91_04685, partial [Candidatus Obscuribacterales bacterium]|nr:hypothetical protein [Candidatus Obscuribacterales bacterium]
MPKCLKTVACLVALMLLAPIAPPPARAQALENDAEEVDVGTQLRAPILAPPEKELPTSSESLEKEKAK